jgi:5'-nucleotidase
LLRLAADGPSHLSLISDFDQTLSKYQAYGQVEHSTFNILEGSGLFTAKFKAEMKEMCEVYFPLEHDTTLPYEARVDYMETWWRRTFDKYLTLGLTKGMLPTMVHNAQLQLRHGISELMTLCKALEVPVTVVSAGLGDFIDMVLRLGVGFDCARIVSNYMLFDEMGKLSGFAEPVIQSLRKSIALQGQVLAHNAIVLGDRPRDVEVIKDVEVSETVCIGYYNGCGRVSREEFEENYDLLVLGDGDLDVVVELLGVVGGRKSIAEFWSFLGISPPTNSD